VTANRNEGKNAQSSRWPVEEDGLVKDGEKAHTVFHHTQFGAACALSIGHIQFAMGRLLPRMH